jgi:predicted MFS family arabinose efflux permease
MPRPGRPAAHGLFSLLSLNFFCGCATGILQLAIPLYAMSLRATTVQLGLIIGIGGVGRMLIIVPSGLVADRFGARRLFAASTAACVLLVGVIYLVSSPWLLMGVMCFQGMAQSVSFLSLQAGFLKRLPRLDPSQAGWQRGATQLGYYLVGPVAGGLLLQGGRYDVTFFLVSGTFVLSLAIVIYRHVSGIPEVVDDAADHGPGEWDKLRSLLSDPLLLQVLGIECLGAAIFMIYRTFVAPVAVEVLRLSVRAVSVIVISQGTAAMATLLGGGGLLRHHATSRVFCGASLLVISGMLLLATARGGAVFWSGSVIYGCGTGLMNLSSLTRIVDVAGEKGKIAALFSLSIAIGSIFGPVLGGFVGELMTVQAAFYMPVLLLTPVLLVLAVRGSSAKRSMAIDAAGE